MKILIENFLKIAMLGHKRIPSREGGVEIVVEELSSRMVNLGHKVVCFNRSGSHVSGKDFIINNLNEYKGIKIKYVFTIDKKGLAAVSSSFFATLRVCFGSFDVVHIHAEGPAFWSFLPKIFGKRVIVTVHGLDHKRAKWGGFASWYIMQGEKHAVKYADEIIVLSKEVKKYFKDMYNRNTNFIPNGVNKPILRKDMLIRDKFNINKDEYILYLGRIVPEKGIQYLIEAFKIINTNKKLVIAGGCSDTESFMYELKNLAQKDKRIIFTDFVEGEILEELYSNAYVYVLPSDLEGMPLSLLEAMSYGNCCIVSNIKECTEVVEDKAIIFDRGNIFDLKEKLELVCNDIRLVEYYKNSASEYICNKYNWDNIVEQTINIYISR